MASDSDLKDISIPIFPATDTYVVYSIDPIASLDNEETSLAADSKELDLIRSRKYVGLASEPIDFLFMEGRPYHRWSIQYLLRPPLLGYVKEGFDPVMHIPVLPNDDNLTGKTPLAPSEPLPWKNCYHSSCYGWVEARCPTMRSATPPNYTLTTKERCRWVELQTEDIGEAVEKIDTLEKDASGIPLVTTDVINEYLESEFRAVVNLSYDLDSLEEFEQPFQFFRDALYLDKLLNDFQANIVEQALQKDAEAFPDSKPKKYRPSPYQRGKRSLARLRGFVTRPFSRMARFLPWRRKKEVFEVADEPLSRQTTSTASTTSTRHSKK